MCWHPMIGIRETHTKRSAESSPVEQRKMARLQVHMSNSVRPEIKDPHPSSFMSLVYPRLGELDTVCA